MRTLSSQIQTDDHHARSHHSSHTQFTQQIHLLFESTRNMVCISIRMNHESCIPCSESLEDTHEVLSVLRSIDRSYTAARYTNRRRRGRESIDSSRIDPLCREKMVEWCYLLSDCGQFPSCREMVAIAFSYLDRYTEIHRQMDRTTFKVAAVTSFYLSTKILSTAQQSIRSLVELGRGEYNDQDIYDMEKSILETLSWRMHPVTSQNFIRQLCAVLCAEMSLETVQADSIFERAIFFTELSVYDRTFVEKDNYTTAVASVLNSIEAFDVGSTFQDNEVCRAVGISLSVDQDQMELEKSQAQLWYLYSCSAQNSSADVRPLALSKKHQLRFQSHESMTRLCRSPLSVRLSC